MNPAIVHSCNEAVKEMIARVKTSSERDPSLSSPFSLFTLFLIAAEKRNVGVFYINIDAYVKCELIFG